MALYKGRLDEDDYADMRSKARAWLSSRRPEDFEDGVLEVEGKIESWPPNERFLARLIIRECQAVYEGRMRKIEKMKREVFAITLRRDNERLTRLYELWQERLLNFPGVWRDYFIQEWRDTYEEARWETRQPP